MRIFAQSIRETADTFLHAGYISAAGHGQDRLATQGDLARSLGELGPEMPLAVATPNAVEALEVVGGPATAITTEIATSPVAVQAAEVATASGGLGPIDLAVLAVLWSPGMMMGVLAGAGIRATLKPWHLRATPYRPGRYRKLAYSMMSMWLLAALAVGASALIRG